MPVILIVIGVLLEALSTFGNQMALACKFSGGNSVDEVQADRVFSRDRRT